MVGLLEGWNLLRLFLGNGSIPIVVFWMIWGDDLGPRALQFLGHVLDWLVKCPLERFQAWGSHFPPHSWLIFLDMTFSHYQAFIKTRHLGTFSEFFDLRTATLYSRHITNIYVMRRVLGPVVADVLINVSRDWHQGNLSFHKGYRTVWQKAGKGSPNIPGVRQRRIISPRAPSPRSKASSSLALTSLDFWRTWVLTLSELCFPWTRQRQEDIQFGEISVDGENPQNIMLHGHIRQFCHVLHRDTVLRNLMAEPYFQEWGPL
jgi:hypothetical protein